MFAIGSLVDKLRSRNQIIAEAKRDFRSFYGYQNLNRAHLQKKLEEYPGFDITAELERFCYHFKANIHTYTVTPVFTPQDIPKFSIS